MFTREHHGKAQAAIEFYISLFPNSQIDKVEHYRAGESEPQGTVKVASFTLNGQAYMAMDSGAAHQFTFTPAVSLFVECEAEDEIRRLYQALAEGGVALMPLNNYGFSKLFGWVNDRFGVSWQLNLVGSQLSTEALGTTK
jgi:predicted 3-demethylubiquinone-9 3-methyltransferase (glyoxalase superfamily)